MASAQFTDIQKAPATGQSQSNSRSVSHQQQRYAPPNVHSSQHINENTRQTHQNSHPSRNGSNYGTNYHHTDSRNVLPNTGNSRQYNDNSGHLNSNTARTQHNNPGQSLQSKHQNNYVSQTLAPNNQQKRANEGHFQTSSGGNQPQPQNRYASRDLPPAQHNKHNPEQQINMNQNRNHAHSSDTGNNEKYQTQSSRSRISASHQTHRDQYQSGNSSSNQQTSQNAISKSDRDQYHSSGQSKTEHTRSQQNERHYNSNMGHQNSYQQHPKANKQYANKQNPGEMNNDRMGYDNKAYIKEGEKNSSNSSKPGDNGHNKNTSSFQWQQKGDNNDKDQRTEKSYQSNQSNYNQRPQQEIHTYKNDKTAIGAGNNKQYTNTHPERQLDNNNYRRGEGSTVPVKGNEKYDGRNQSNPVAPSRSKHQPQSSSKSSHHQEVNKANAPHGIYQNFSKSNTNLNSEVQGHHGSHSQQSSQKTRQDVANSNMKSYQSSQNLQGPNSNMKSYQSSQNLQGPNSNMKSYQSSQNLQGQNSNIKSYHSSHNLQGENSNMKSYHNKNELAEANSQNVNKTNPTSYHSQHNIYEDQYQNASEKRYHSTHDIYQGQTAPNLQSQTQQNAQKTNLVSYHGTHKQMPDPQNKDPNMAIHHQGQSNTANVTNPVPKQQPHDPQKVTKYEKRSSNKASSQKPQQHSSNNRNAPLAKRKDRLQSYQETGFNGPTPSHREEAFDPTPTERTMSMTALNHIDSHPQSNGNALASSQPGLFRSTSVPAVNQEPSVNMRPNGNLHRPVSTISLALEQARQNGNLRRTASLASLVASNPHLARTASTYALYEMQVEKNKVPHDHFQTRVLSIIATFVLPPLSCIPGGLCWYSTNKNKEVWKTDLMKAINTNNNIFWASIMITLFGIVGWIMIIVFVALHV